MIPFKQKQFHEFVKEATYEELIWMSGFLQGMLLRQENVGSKNLSVSALSLLFGTETGNSKKLASEFASKLKKMGVKVKLKGMDQYRLTDLEKEEHLLIVVSTHGDGEPPEAGKKFFHHIQNGNISLSGLQYAVIGLGDSAYPLFCKAGEDLDERLAQLGAKRMTDLKKCDVDFEKEAHQWLDALLEKVFCQGLSSPILTKQNTSSGRQKTEAELLLSVNLNDTHSNKETYHLELETLEPLDYQSGDALGIIAKNSKISVDKILQLLGIDGSDLFDYKGIKYSAANLLTDILNIEYLPLRIIENYRALTDREISGKQMGLVDLLQSYPLKSGSIQQLIAILDPITPRLYSIASSPSAHGCKEVHLTVSKHQFSVNEEKCFGLCSNYLSCLKLKDRLNVYVQKNSAFKLPDPDVDMIMVGPGTGIAPFRSFLFERDATGAKGKNWLIFGEQYFISDFLYQTELQSFYETGVLTKLNTAFSRDQKEKVYVQHKLKQNADEFINWLDQGAYLYICGAKDPMSCDVEKTLIEIFQEKKNYSLSRAEEELQSLKDSGRYQKDVY